MGVNAANWAELQESYFEPAFRAGLDAVGVGARTRLLDVGCGAGRALRLAADRGAEVTGLDAAPGLLEFAGRRVPAQIAEHVGGEAVRQDIEAFLAKHIRPDGTYAIPNPFRYAVSTPIH